MQPKRSPFDSLRYLWPRSLKHLSDSLSALVRGRLWLQVLVGLFLGILVGVVIGPSTGLLDNHTAAVVGNWLALPGHVFLALIQMIVIPLVIASIIRGLAASESIGQLRSMGLRVVAFFVATTALAIVIGVALALAIEPGRFVDANLIQSTLGEQPQAVHNVTPAPLDIGQLPERLVTLLPSNPIDSMVQGQMLQLVLFAVIFGIALVMLPPAQSRPLLDLLGSLQEVCMTIVRWAMWLAPLAVFGLIAQLTTKVGIDALLGMTVYVGTVLLGLLILMAFYLFLVFGFARWSPRRFLASVREVLLLAFSTSSSVAVMPLTIKTAEEGLGVRYSVSHFVIPFGATINMNGTALYQGVAAIFLAQVYGVDITVGGLLLLVITTVGASIGSPGTPGVGIVIMALVLDTIGIPTAGIALILGVDRLLDMSRTAINVCGDLTASVLVDRWVAREPAEVVPEAVAVQCTAKDSVGR